VSINRLEAPAIVEGGGQFAYLHQLKSLICDMLQTMKECNVKHNNTMYKQMGLTDVGRLSVCQLLTWLQ